MVTQAASASAVVPIAVVIQRVIFTGSFAGAAAAIVMAAS
jgi:hypothetical protein